MAETAIEGTAVREAAPGRLLFVDDEHNILAALRRLFHGRGYEVHTAPSAAAGLQILSAQSIDIVVSDMRMPEMDGARFLEEVADRWPDVVRILLTGYADLSSTISAINKGRIYGYFRKPWEDSEILIAVDRALERKRLEEERRHLEGLTREQNEQLRQLNATLEERVRARTEELRQANMFLELSYQELTQSYFAAIPVFSNLVELREGEQGGHSRRVAELAQRLAEAAGFDQKQTRDVFHAGLLHDIGKHGLSDEILRLPSAELTVDQRKQAEKHPTLGQAVLMGLEPLQTAALLIRHHHERWDGQGYPDGLVGEAIPPGARVLAIVNEYDNLRSGAMFGESLDAGGAQTFMAERRGMRYEPRLLDLFLEMMRDEQTPYAVSELHLRPGKLLPGMALSRDLRSNEGVLLLSAGHHLTQPLIERIVGFEKDAGRQFLVHVKAEENQL